MTLVSCIEGADPRKCRLRNVSAGKGKSGAYRWDRTFAVVSNIAQGRRAPERDGDLQSQLCAGRRSTRTMR